MMEQAIQYGTEYYQKLVFMLEFDEEMENVHKKTVYKLDVMYKARALMSSTGHMGRKPSFKGETEYLRSGVSYWR